MGIGREGAVADAALEKLFCSASQFDSIYLSCYQVGSLDFKLFGKRRIFHWTHQQLNFLQRGPQQPSHQSQNTGIVFLK